MSLAVVPPARVVVAIPTRFYLPTLSPLIDLLLHEDAVDSLWLYDNGHDTVEGLSVLNRADATPVAQRVSAYKMSIYEMWNDAWRQAAYMHPGERVFLLLLNDDIVLAPGTVGAMRDVLLADDKTWVVGANYHRSVEDGVDPTAGVQEVGGSYRTGGIGGFAFMIDASASWDVIPPIDESYEWWCGDDDLFGNVVESGHRLAIALGVPVEHVSGSSAAQVPELGAAMGRDAKRWLERHGGERL